MTDIFTQSFFSGNRQKLRDMYGDSTPIVITANGLIQSGTDSAMPFHQDASFWYFTGIEEPDVVLVMAEKEEYLLVPERDASRIAFDGAISDEALQKRSGVSHIVNEEEGWELLTKELKRTKKVATLSPGPARIERLALYVNPARHHVVEKMHGVQTNLEVIDLRTIVMQMRMIKQAPELDALKQAISITAAGISYVSDRTRLATYTYEYEIEADLHREFRRLGARGHAFEPIVASGKRACTLHNLANDGKLRSSDLLVTDVGAEVMHYDADITRTVAIGEPSKRQQEVYSAVCAVQDYAKALLIPGADYVAYEGQVLHFMGEQLRALGLMQDADEELIRHYYPHATSHFLGLDTHDVGDYHMPLAPGMVLTCEPGIYIPEEGIGIRIEDDIVITQNGNDNLSSDLPRRLV